MHTRLRTYPKDAHVAPLHAGTSVSRPRAHSARLSQQGDVASRAPCQASQGGGKTSGKRLHVLAPSVS